MTVQSGLPAILLGGPARHAFWWAGWRAGLRDTYLSWEGVLLLTGSLQYFFCAREIDSGVSGYKEAMPVQFSKDYLNTKSSESELSAHS
jgi:hypothetical protein